MSQHKPVGKIKARFLAEDLVKFSEGHLFPPLTDEARAHFVSVLSNTIKDFYKNTEGKWAHTETENKTLIQEFPNIQRIEA